MQQGHIEARSPEGLKLAGGRLCLDFINTLGGRTGERVSEHLGSFGELVTWSVRADALDERQAERLRRAAPLEGRVALRRALALREVLYRIFRVAAEGTEPASDDMALFNGALAEAMAHSRVQRRGDGFVWAWDENADALHRMLWPIARSAAELLTSPDVGRVRQCPGENCGWLFVDTTKNGSRRWCDMEICGNRAKARRHYERRKNGAQSQRLRRS